MQPWLADDDVMLMENKNLGHMLVIARTGWRRQRQQRILCGTETCFILHLINFTCHVLLDAVVAEFPLYLLLLLVDKLF